MKIAILTWLHNGNYGSVLQAYALQKYLKKENMDVININYKLNIFGKLINWIKSGNSLDLFKEKYKIRNTKKDCKNPEEFLEKNVKFENFKKSNMNLTPIFNSPQKLKANMNNYNIFICGSDQIWSPRLMNPVYYLNFVNKPNKKISYAPSFGVIKTTKKKEKNIRNLVNDFDYISVREKQGKKFLEKIGIKKNISVVVDPTLLLNINDWNMIEKKINVNEKYIFCYFLKSNKKYIHHVKEYAKEKNLKVIIVPTAVGPFNSGFNELINIGPEEWLGLIKRAEIVFTDSFHGAVFSTIFHKNFILFKRFLDNDNKSENSRIYNFTKMLNIENVIVDPEIEKLSIYNINYKDVDNCMNKMIKDSKMWIENAILNNEFGN